MSSHTKIVVLRSKQLVYTLVLLIVSVLIVMVAVSLFVPSKNSGSGNGAAPSTPSNTTEEEPSGTDAGTDTSGSTDLYVPGVYSSTLQLGSSNVELQITVDRDHINSINLTNIDESVETLYPLMSPTLEELSAVILSEQSIENVSYSDDNRYTSMLLMQAISETLDKARVSENADTPETGIIY